MDIVAAGQGLCDIMRQLPRRDFFLMDHSILTLEAMVRVNSKALPVLAAYSEHTIYVDPMINRAQRALHDTIHLAFQAETTLADEYRVAIEQARLISHHSQFLADVAFADLRGQALYFDHHGFFPDNQIAFTYHWLATRDVRRIF